MLTDQIERRRIGIGIQSAIRETVTRNKITVTQPFPRPSDRWVKRFCKGDVLITGRGSGGLVGHAAIMATDEWVLEMPGGKGWWNGIEDNNRRIRKNDWLKLHEEDRITLYRNVNTDVAHAAADWAYKNYYNPNGGSEKTQHITYRLTQDVWATDPSYCSKLVIQAYHFGSGDRDVIKNTIPLDALDGRRIGCIVPNEILLDSAYIVPTTLPTYFKSPYRLVNVAIMSLIEGVINYFTE